MYKYIFHDGIHNKNIYAHVVIVNGQINVITEANGQSGEFSSLCITATL